VKLHDVKYALLSTYEDIGRNHTSHMAAALSYHFVLSLFPALILLSAIVAYLPVPDLFGHTLNLMSDLMPADSMGLIRRILVDVITANRRTVLSFGLLGTLWTSSRGFAGAIEALNLAYDIKDDRPLWKTCLLAVALALTIGFLVLVALSVIVVGPKFGEWLASQVHLSATFVRLWPYVRWTIAGGFAVLAVEILYFFAPNVKQGFRATFPGAVFAVTAWIGMSSALGAYFRLFAKFNETYGTLGAAIALMVWLYWTGFAILVGAELNAELAKVGQGDSPPEQPKTATVTEIHFAA
jgi:membrane protein